MQQREVLQASATATIYPSYHIRERYKKRLKTISIFG
jgi:hypothetical protein